MADISSTSLFPPPTPGPSNSAGPWLADETYDQFDLGDVADACAAHITALLPTTDEDAGQSAKSSRQQQQGPIPPLRDFISYAIRRTRLPPAMAFSAVALVRRFKQYYPDAAAAPDSRHRLFLAAYILTSKLLQDNPFEQKAWKVVANGAFTAADIRKMERELCRYLGWNLSVCRAELDELVLDQLSPWLFAPSPSSSSSTAPSPTTLVSSAHSPAVGHSRSMSVESTPPTPQSRAGESYWSSPRSDGSDDSTVSCSSEGASTCSTAETSPAYSTRTCPSSVSPKHRHHHHHHHHGRHSRRDRKASSTDDLVEPYRYLPPPRSASSTAVPTATEDGFRR